MIEAELYTRGFIEARDKLEKFDLGDATALRRLADLLDCHGVYSQGAAACLRLRAADLEAEVQ